MSDKIILFVYGTLLEGCANHERLGNARKMTDDAWVYGSLYDTNCGYPALMINQEGKVFGELYEVPKENMPTIDALEGFFGPNDPANLYERTEIEVTTAGRTMNALTYVFPAFRTRLLQKIESGNWRIYESEGI